FLAGLMFVLPVSIFYHKFKGVKSVVSGLVTGTFIMAFGMSVLNYFIILPAYSWFMGWEMTSLVKWVSVIAGVLQFNLVYGGIVGLLFVLFFLNLTIWIDDHTVNSS